MINNRDFLVSIRRLKEKDAQLMLEWMHDKKIAGAFRRNFSEFNEISVVEFIKRSNEIEDDLHMAIVDEFDEYLGTISLKNIDRNEESAEYAIVLRKAYQHCGIGKKATDLILEYAFNVLGLKNIYLNVLETNKDAIRFYTKYGFRYFDRIENDFQLDDIPQNTLWYCIKG